MAAGGKPGKKKTKKTKQRDGEWCLPDCTLNRKHSDDMIECHLCQIWVHYHCITEAEEDIVGIWCCNACRKLSYNVSILCNKINDLQRDMATLIKYATLLDSSKKQYRNTGTVCDSVPDASDL